MDTRLQDTDHAEQHKVLTDPSSFDDDLQQLDMDLEPVTIHGSRHQYQPSVTSSQYVDSACGSAGQFKTGRFAEKPCPTYEFLRQDEYDLRMGENGQVERFKFRDD